PVPHAAYAGFSGAMVAPMVWGGETLGVLGVGRRGGGSFAPGEADALQTFAGLASLALRNAETFADRTRQAQVQQGFYRIASVLGQSLSLAATYDAVAQAATEALGGSYAAVLTPRPGHLELAGAYQLPDRLREALEADPQPHPGPLGEAAVQAPPAPRDGARPRRRARRGRAAGAGADRGGRLHDPRLRGRRARRHRRGGRRRRRARRGGVAGDRATLRRRRPVLRANRRRGRDR